MSSSLDSRGTNLEMGKKTKMRKKIQKKMNRMLHIFRMVLNDQINQNAAHDENVTNFY